MRLGKSSAHARIGGGIEVFALDSAELPCMRLARTGRGAADRQIADQMQRGIHLAELADAQDDCVLLGVAVAADELPCVVIEMMTDERDIAALEDMRAGQDKQVGTLAERIVCHKNLLSVASDTIMIQENAGKIKRECDKTVKLCPICRKNSDRNPRNHRKPPESMIFETPFCKKRARFL